MKYSNLHSFQQHLKNAAPHNLCRFYLICLADDFERTKILDSIVAYLGASPSRFSGASASLRDIIDASQNMTFLCSEPVVIVDELDKFSKKDLQSLAEHFALLSGRSLFGSRSKTALAALVEKEGVVLDMLEEKSWDKEKRLKEQLYQLVINHNKRLDKEAEVTLFERLGSDPALLYSEIDKLLVFVGERPVITKADVLAISPASKVATLWSIAEEIVWEKGRLEALDNNAIHGLPSLLRHQLHIGLTLSTLIEEKRPATEWTQYVPKLWPKILEKRSSQAAHLGTLYFQRGLKSLFEMELLLRSLTTHPRVLLEQFRCRLHGG